MSAFEKVNNNNHDRAEQIWTIGKQSQNSVSTIYFTIMTRTYLEEKLNRIYISLC